MEFINLRAPLYVEWKRGALKRDSHDFTSANIIHELTFIKKQKTQNKRHSLNYIINKEFIIIKVLIIIYFKSMIFSRYKNIKFYCDKLGLGALLP